MVDFCDWLKAQEVERSFHTMDKKEGIKHYAKTYAQYFKWLDIDYDLKGKCVAEVGPADFPALSYCQNIGASFIVEPMPSKHLYDFNIMVCNDMAEDVDFSMCDEVWLFNVLQHTLKPGNIIENAKKAKCVKFFEPINYGTDGAHLHNFTLDYFRLWFGEVKHYPKNQTAVNFHQWECAYGIWNR